jgi:hypothetical protein
MVADADPEEPAEPAAKKRRGTGKNNLVQQEDGEDSEAFRRRGNGEKRARYVAKEKRKAQEIADATDAGANS